MYACWRRSWLEDTGRVVPNILFLPLSVAYEHGVCFSAEVPFVEMAQFTFCLHGMASARGTFASTPRGWDLVTHFFGLNDTLPSRGDLLNTIALSGQLPAKTPASLLLPRSTNIPPQRELRMCANLQRPGNDYAAVFVGIQAASCPELGRFELED